MTYNTHDSHEDDQRSEAVCGVCMSVNIRMSRLIQLDHDQTTDHVHKCCIYRSDTNRQTLSPFLFNRASITQLLQGPGNNSPQKTTFRNNCSRWFYRLDQTDSTKAFMICLRFGFCWSLCTLQLINYRKIKLKKTIDRYNSIKLTAYRSINLRCYQSS